MNTAQHYEKAMEYEHKNPPKPFNPDAASNRACWVRAMRKAEIEEQQAGVKWTRPQRARRRVELYDAELRR